MQPLKNLVLQGNKDSLSLLYVCSHFMQTFFYKTEKIAGEKTFSHLFRELERNCGVSWWGNLHGIL